MKKWSILGLILVLSISLLIGCTNNHFDQPRKKEQSKTRRLEVYASFYPLAFFAKEIGGNQVAVHNITPVGTEPHDYEPTQRELIQINQSDMLIYNGAGLEGWIEKIKDNLNPQKTVVVEAAKNISLHPNVEEEHHEEETHHEHEGNYDPHVWLDPLLAKKQAENIKDVFIQKDPQHKELYEKNFDELAKRLDQLDQAYRTMTSQVKKKDVITSHAAFGYLVKRYGLNQVPISGLSPDEEPSAKKLKEVIQFAQQKNIHYIFFEKLVHPKVATVVTNEIHAKPLTLDPLEGLTLDEYKKGEDYFTVAMRNLQNLKIALQ